MNSKIKRILSAGAEALIIIFPMVWASMTHPEHVDAPTAPLVFCAMTAGAIVLLKLAEYLVFRLLERKDAGSARSARIITSAVCFIPAAAVFFLALVALRSVCDMPALTVRLLIYSLIAAVAHTALNFMLDALFGVVRGGALGSVGGRRP